VRELIEESLDTANEILKDLKEREEELKEVNKKIADEYRKYREAERQIPSPKQTTLDSRMASIESLEQRRTALGDHRRENSGGYMFGVLVCLTGKKFAAVSGGETPDGFKAIAESHGCTVIMEAATLEDFKAINPRCAAKDTKAIDKMEEQWDATVIKAEGQKVGYNEPGTCAGAKLIGKSGHVAHSMTEIYFSFSGTKKFNYDVFYRGPSDHSPSMVEGAWKPPTAAVINTGEGGEPVEERFKMRSKQEETVLSCQACQDTLFMARCDIEVQTCG
jgi:hypothetical protein